MISIEAPPEEDIQKKLPSGADMVKRKIVERLLEKGESPEFVAEITGLTMEELILLMRI